MSLSAIEQFAQTLPYTFSLDDLNTLEENRVVLLNNTCGGGCTAAEE